jgi:MFS family permease
MTATAGPSCAQPPYQDHPAAPPRRWAALVVLAAAIGIDVMGVAVVNTALPQIGAQLGLSPGSLPWVMTIYAVAFAGFLLLGGRAADVLGRRRVFLAGIALYAAGSLGAALVPVSEVLLGARLLQGIGAATSGPAALALIPQVVTDESERGKAMSVYTAVGASSFAGGLVLGGVLTQVAGWRSVFTVLAVVSVLVIIAAPFVLPRGHAGHGLSLDLPGGFLVAAGLIALVVGVSSVETSGLLSARALVPTLAGLVLLSGFVVRKRTARQPLLPLSIFTGAAVRAARTPITGPGCSPASPSCPSDRAWRSPP